MNISVILKDYSPDEIAKYIRLSLEDKNKKTKVSDESESISNQRIILNQFIDRHGNKGIKCREFIDDGKSGTNFERPGWKELLDEIEAGKIKVVITKNLSRLGRSNFECGYYMDYYFPSLNVRFMTVQEEVDTYDLYNSSNEYAPLNNFMNEKYSRDLSKNVRNSKRIKQEAGEYIGGSNTPFGYKRDPLDKHHLIIEETEATVIRKIFNWYLETGSQNAVKRKLYENKIPTPAVVRNYKNCKRRTEETKYIWDNKTIKDILSSETYLGSMVQHKYIKKSFRQKKLTKVPREEWISVPDKHDAIIKKTVFDKVQNLLKANYKRGSERDPELLNGLLVCHDCKHNMYISKKDHIGKDGKLYKQYYTQCNYYRRNKRLNLCSLHSVNYFDLENQVLELLRNICSKFLKMIDYENITKEHIKEISTLEKTLSDKILKTEDEIKNLDRKIQEAYDDKLEGIISVDTYIKFSESLEEKKKSFQRSLEELEADLVRCQEDNSLDNYLEAGKVAKAYMKSKKNISRDLILQLVDRIEIHDDKTIDLFLKIKPLEQLM